MLDQRTAHRPRSKEFLCVAFYRKRTVLATSSNVFFLSCYSDVDVPGNQAVRISKARPPLSMTTL